MGSRSEELKAIIDTTFNIGLYTYLLLFVGCSLSGFLGAYLSSYSREKAKNLATKEDYEDLKKQTSDLTLATESVKNEIAENSLKASKQWELKFQIYTQLLEALSEWRVHIWSADIEMFESDGSQKDFINEEKIKEILKKNRSVFINMARMEALADIVLTEKQGDTVRSIKSIVSDNGHIEDRHEKNNEAIRKIKALERQIADEAKKELFGVS